MSVCTPATGLSSTTAAHWARSGSRLLRLLLLTIVVVSTSCGGSSQPTEQAGLGGAPAEQPTTAASVTVEAQETVAPAASPATPLPEATARPMPTPTTSPAPTPSGAHRTTIDELLNNEAPLSLAHAGGDQAAPHSTMFAFKAAVAAGVDMLEIDVQLTADGELIVHHDATVDGTTDGTGLALDFTLAEIQALDNAYWFAEACWPCRDFEDDAYLYRGVRTGEQPAPAGYSAEDFRIITMRELVEQFPTLAFDIEIKGEPAEAMAVAEALAIEIEELELADSVVVVSFSDEVVAAFEAAAPHVETSPGTNELGFWVLTDVPVTGNRIVQVPPFFDGLEVLNEDFIARADAAGLEVWVWPNDAATQENVDFYRELIELGVDGIIAGRPAVMETARNEPLD